MVRPGAMFFEIMRSLLKKAATIKYPYKKFDMFPKFRGKLKFDASKCIGCKLCMKDCPADAINIVKVADKKFIAEIHLDKCLYCAQCVDSCMKKALESTQEYELAQLDRKKLKVTYN